MSPSTTPLHPHVPQAAGPRLARLGLSIAGGLVGAAAFESIRSTEYANLATLACLAASLILLAATALWMAQLERADMDKQAETLFGFIQRDALTGLLNRTFFVDHLRSMQCDGVLMMIDADHFKAVNDNYGHLAGDVALAHIAQALVAGAGDRALVGRLGGEEFGVFLPGYDLDAALVVAEAIRTRVEAAQPEAAGARIRMSVSIGMAEHGKNNPVSETFKHADDLLFAAKRAGRNCVIGAQHKVLNIARVHKAAERRRHVRLYH